MAGGTVYARVKYPEKGSYLITVTATGAVTGLVRIARGTASVGDAHRDAEPGAEFTATCCKSFDGRVVATFTDDHGEDKPHGLPPGDYAGTIEWGGGSRSAGKFVAAGGVLEIHGGREYVIPGEYLIHTSVRDEAWGKADTFTTVTVVPEDPGSGTLDLVAHPVRGVERGGAGGILADFSGLPRHHPLGRRRATYADDGGLFERVAVSDGAVTGFGHGGGLASSIIEPGRPGGRAGTRHRPRPHRGRRRGGVRPGVRVRGAAPGHARRLGPAGRHLRVRREPDAGVGGPRRRGRLPRDGGGGGGPRHGDPPEPRAVVALTGLGETTASPLDAGGRIWGRTRADATTEAWDRDAAGDATTYQDPDGYLTGDGWGGFGDVVSVAEPDGRARLFAHDNSFHLLTRSVDGDGHPTRYTLNGHDRRPRHGRRGYRDGRVRRVLRGRRHDRRRGDRVGQPPGRGQRHAVRRVRAGDAVGRRVRDGRRDADVHDLRRLRPGGDDGR